MRKLIIGGIAALAMSLVAAPAAQADPGNDECCAHEFDWAIPYYDAFERHGIGYLSYEHGIPLMNDVDRFCSGRETQDSIRTEYSLSYAEAETVVEAAHDVCPPGPLLRAQ